jgi:hypothetical protein
LSLVSSLFCRSIAQTSDERRAVVDAAFRLIGADTDEDYRVAKTLQVVQSEIADRTPILAQDGWPLRSLAAILWVRSSNLTPELGETLIRDVDVRVRRTLAVEVRDSDDPRTADVRAVLETDPRWSVRSQLLSN